MLLASDSSDGLVQWLSVLIAITALIPSMGGLAVVLRKVKNLVQWVMVLRRDIKTVVDFLESRGQVEAFNQGHASPPGGRPFAIHADVRARFAPIEQGLWKLAAEPVNLQDSDSLFLRIEREYKDWLVENVCVPLRVNKGACLALALEVAREKHRASA